MKAGEICLTSLPQADGREKIRPILIIVHLPGHNDWLVCGISSQINKQIEGWDLLLDKKSSFFNETGLKMDSIVRLSFLASLSSEKIMGKIGSIPDEMLHSVKHRLSRYLLQE
jgi:mRNA interferase MazF